MWSDRYNYYNIQSDISFSENIDLETAVAALLQTNCFKQINHQNFSNVEHFPWTEIMLTESKDGNFAVAKKEVPFINLIAIVCSKGINVDESIYVDAFSKIAKSLNWKLYLEEDDYGNENVEII